MSKEITTIYPSSRHEWRQWLQDNHRSATSVWLVYYRKKSGKPSLSWSEAVDEALCFGWIDSVKKSIDEDTFMQYFGPRKAKSVWSRINKDKVQRLMEEGLMTPAGVVCIEIAKQNGSWTTLDEAEELIIPDELDHAFSEHDGSKEFFLGLSKSVKKAILQWLALAKRPETRQKRSAEIAELAGQKRRPKQF